MRISSKVSVSIALFFLGIIWGTVSYSQDTEPEKPAGRVIPEELTANLNISFYSQYVWRGLELSKDSLVIFPSATIGYKGFACNIWVDLDTDFNNPPPGSSSEATLQETDLTLTYNNQINPLKLDYTFGWIYYDTDGFYGDSPTTNQELFLTLALDFPLKPTMSVYSEIETGTAWYTSLGVSHSFQAYRDWSLDVGGWVSYLYNEEEDFSDLHDGNLWIGLAIPLNSYCSVTPKLQYSFPLSSDSDDRIKANSFNGNDAQFLYGGIVVDLNF